MSDTVSVSREIAASPETLWAMVSDVTRMGEWSPENEGCSWMGDANAPKAGAKFRGSNRIGKKSWKSVSTIVDAEPGRRFSFRVAAGPFRVAEWGYTFEETSAGCRVTETWKDQRGRLFKPVSAMATGVPDRASHNRAGMEQTLERLAAVAESSAAPS